MATILVAFGAVALDLTTDDTTDCGLIDQE